MGSPEIKRITAPMKANDDMMLKNAVDADNKNEMTVVINENINANGAIPILKISILNHYPQSHYGFVQ